MVSLPYHAFHLTNWRSGGHLKPDSFIRSSQILPTHGRRAAEEVASFEYRHLKAVGDVVKRERIDCDFVLTRCIDVSLEDKGRDDLKAKLDSLVEAGLPVDDVFYCSEKTAEGVRLSVPTLCSYNEN